jgi:hypothetical protein
MAHNTTKRCILIERIRNYVKSHMNRYKKYKIAHHHPPSPSPQSYHEPKGTGLRPPSLAPLGSNSENVNDFPRTSKAGSGLPQAMCGVDKVAPTKLQTTSADPKSTCLRPFSLRGPIDFGSNNKNGTSSSDQIDTYTSSSPKSIIPSWKAPPIHGLQNSSRIIPEYYTSTNLKNGILKINYYDIIIDDIRNLRPLSSHQMKYIRKNLTHTEYYNIIHEYNQVMQVYLESYLLSL